MKLIFLFPLLVILATRAAANVNERPAHRSPNPSAAKEGPAKDRPTEAPLTVRVNVKKQMDLLLKTADTDSDHKLTVSDLHSPKCASTKSSFFLEDVNGKKYEVSGIYFLSNLLQELKLAEARVGPDGVGTILSSHVFENPVQRISRSIRELYWDGLTRRVDADHLEQVLNDSKIASTLANGVRNLYVPQDDPATLAYFESASLKHPELKMKVWALPNPLTSQAELEVANHQGLLALGLRAKSDGGLEGVPFVVPGGRFNEMYGWDSFFESLGLIADGKTDLARSMVDNFVYEIDHYGKILNANRTYYLNRSQPPFLTTMISEVYEHLPRTTESKAWLRHSLAAAIREYDSVWLGPARLTDTGLSRYYGNGHSIPPEVEKGHFDFILKPAAKRHHVSLQQLQTQYNSGQIQDPELDDFFSQDRAVRESGHDTTYRWRVSGQDKAADFVTVDLNSLLYKYELDLARLIKTEFQDNFKDSPNQAEKTSRAWIEKARARKQAMLKYLWNPEKKIFFDYDFKNKKRSRYVSATAFYPFWAVDPDDPESKILGPQEARASFTALLEQLEQPGGLSGTSQASLLEFGDRKNARQWDYPNGWAPHQILAWEGLRNYGETKTADRLIYKWLYTITRNAADFNGTVPEKFDVVRRSHAVFAEYGNVGTQFSYITKEGFGWMNASYQVGLQFLSREGRQGLEALIPPEWMNF